MLKVEAKQNLERTKNLLLLYREARGRSIADDQTRKDLLRACVVFLHSTVEELVRNLYLEILPTSKSFDVLNRIPFDAKLSGNEKPKGILLGDFVKKFGSSFTENIPFYVINEHTSTLNVNSTDQLSGQLENVGINLEPLRPYYGALSEVMVRRHQIVHQMDRSTDLDPNNSPISDIEDDLLQKWLDAVEQFIAEIVKQRDAMVT